MISYAQNFEDVILHRVFHDKKDGFYVDVGAADPVVDSVTKFFYEQGWSGINVEPNELFYGRLLEDRPRDINLNLALGDREENRELYLFEDIGNSTFEEASRDRSVASGFEVKSKVVKVTTLAAVYRDYVRSPIDFLKIDCEGWEEFVLKGAAWDEFRPTVMIVEATEPGTSTPSWSAWEPYLFEHARYDMVYFDGLNRFYIPRELADLRAHFQVPPNVFDDFAPYATVEAHERIKSLGQERDLLAAKMAGLETQLKDATLENRELAESLMNAAVRSASLTSENLALTRSLADLEARIAEQQRVRSELDRSLAKMRLWVGQLSQDLAASRQRQ